VSNGSLMLNGDGSFDYTPDVDFVGQDSFTYLANDTELDSALASVTIVVSDTAPSADSVVELELNEGAGTVAVDGSGSGNDGTLVNGASYEAASGDGSAFSVRLDGVDDSIELGSVDVEGPGLTLAAWFRADDFPGRSKDPRLISKATGTGADDHVFMLSTIRDGSTVRLRARVRVGGSTTTLIGSSGDVASGVWHHAAVTYDGAMLRLYLDADEVGNTPLSGAVDTDPSVPVTVGGQPPGAGPRFFDGLIDDVRIASRALSEGELLDIVSPPMGEAPVAVDDSYQTEEDAPLVVGAATGVLDNDTDADGDLLQSVLEDDVSNGVLTLNADGSFSYVPNPNYSGQDQFTYRANDGARTSNLATVTLGIEGDNDAPTALDDSYQTPSNQGLSVSAAGGVLSNDTDPEQDSLSATLVDDVSNGSLMLNGDGSFDYTPDVDFVGQDSFTYLANDTELDSALASVTIVVSPVGETNQQPQFVTGGVGFSKQVVDDTLGETHAAAAADFNGDGLIDLVATDYTDGMVFWYENDGAGGFLTRTLDPDLFGAYPIGVSDVNADGNLDVLAAGYDADTFVWYQSNGAGGFTPRYVDTASNGAHSIVGGDLDDDGDVDLVTSSQDANSIAWYENDGSNNFSRRIIDTTSSGAKRAEIADLDGDGDKDIVTASYFNDEIAWHENDGSENFTKRVIDTTANGAYYVFPADVDGDGDTDVFSASQLDNTIAWYRNDGSAGFSRRLIDASAARARTVIGADINGDGFVDAVSASVDDDTVAWYENDGSGNFAAYLVDGGAEGAYGVFASDINQDGLLDILSASRDSAELAVHTQLRAHSASLGLGDTVVIDSGLLRVEDVDDSASELTYTITVAPSFGQLEIGGVAVSAGGAFTQKDIDDGLFTYTHGGVDQSPDRFDFVVADGGEDGTASLLGTFAIEVVGFVGSVVELPLDEGAGTVAVDVSGQGNDGTLVNGAAFEASTGDGSAFAVRLDGLDDSIDLGSVDVEGTGLTLAARFNADDFPGSSNDPRLISKATGTSANDHVFMLGTIRAGADVRLRARVRTGGVTTTLIASSGALSTGEWYHAAATYDGASLRLYLNGVEVGSSPFLGSVDVDPSVAVAVGSQPPGAGDRNFDGLIDDVRITSRALSRSEIAQLASGN